MRGLGKVSRELLADIGIHTVDDIQEIGVIEVYKRMKRTYPKFTTLNMLWGLEAAVNDMDWRDISPERKAELKALLKEE